MTARALLAFLWAFSCACPSLLTAQTKPMKQEPDYSAEWKQIDSLKEKGLYRSALDQATALYQRAKSDKKDAQVVKAALYQANFIGLIEEDGSEAAIEWMKREAETAGFPVQPVLQSVLAELYRQYKEQRAWEIDDRTPIQGDPGDDIKTWPADVFEAEIARLYLVSVEYPRLKEIPLKDFGAILERERNTQGLWNTLYDLLAFRAIAYFSDSRSALNRPAYRFYLDRAEAFADADTFAVFAFPTKDSTDYEYRALRLYQEVLRTAAKGSPAAWLDADIKRLAFVHEKSVHELKDALYISALERLEARFPSLPGVTEALYARASVYVKWGNQYSPEKGDAHRLDKVKAKSIAQEGVKRFPGSYGGQLCAELYRDLTRMRAEVQVEEVCLPNRPVLASVEFQNAPKVYLKLLRLSAGERARVADMSYQSRRPYLDSLPAFRKWEQPLPEDGDLQTHRTEIALDELPLGHYALMVLPREQASGVKDQDVSIAFFSVSNLAYFFRATPDGYAGFLVTHRETGKPLEGVNVELEMLEYGRRGERSKSDSETGKTDKNGLVRFAAQGKSFTAGFSLGEDSLYYDDRLYVYGGSRDERPRATEETHFFLDRSIYRPGQTIYFKGICLVRQGPLRSPEILPNRRVKVTLHDVNSDEVAVRELTTNAFGSFSGTFTAPSGGLLGSMYLESSVGESYHSFRVEEYKRPRFEVSFKPLEGTAQLGEEVVVKGEAKNYAGNAVDGAAVSYRVTRTARYPWWPWWRGAAPYSEAMEIAVGKTTTDAQGNFSVRFTAAPDLSVPAEQLPEFRYELHADVVDVTGETHSATRLVHIGYVPLRASIEVPEWIDKADPPSLGIRTENLDGQKTPVQGTLQILSLKAPDRWFVKRYWEKPDRPSLDSAVFKQDFPGYAFGKEDDPAFYAVEKTAWETLLNTGQSDTVAIPWASLPPGYYMAVFATTDGGAKREVRKWFQVFDSSKKAGPFASPVWATWAKSKVEPGETALFRLSDGTAPTPVFLEIKRGRETLSAEWISPQGWTEKPWRIVEEDRGDIACVATYVRDNRAFSESYRLEVPWTNKELRIEFQTFRDKLLPGQEEEWRLRISGPGTDRAAAELLAGMYDASLDQFARHEWGFDLFGSRYQAEIWSAYHFGGVQASCRFSFPLGEKLEKRYPVLNTFGLFDISFNGGIVMMMDAVPMQKAMVRSAMPTAPLPAAEMDSFSAKMTPYAPSPPPAKEGDAAKPVAEPLSVRRNLNETVFFFPQIKTDADGAVIIAFKMNEALTRWKFMALAHSKELQSAYATRTVVTQKDLMVFPNAPRFVRENDVLEFSAKVSNLSSKALQGQARLELFDAATMQPVDADFGNTSNSRAFSADAGLSAPLSWKIKVPYGKVGALTWRVSATAGDFSDAEENSLPVLSNRMLVTESLPLFVRGKSSKNFTLESMKTSGDSKSLTPFRLSLEFSSNPAWLAVKALPYLMEYPFECSEQVFSRYYANALAGSVVESSPKIRAIFEQWKGTDALMGQLEKNQELKAVLLEETPWVLEARSEEEQRRNIGILFDINRMRSERTAALEKLKAAQYPSGGFPWFGGGPESWYITQHIVAGMGKLGYLNIGKDPLAEEILSAGVAYLDAQVADAYQKLLQEIEAGRAKKEDVHLSSLLIHYLYARSFVSSLPLSEGARPAWEFYLGQAAQFWTSQGLMEQGMIALALRRAERAEQAAGILASLRERALRSDEMGMYWKTTRGYFWNQRPVETQSLLIEVFDEIGKNTAEVDELKLWLLKNKQTNDWETTKATSDAVYALFRTGAGANWLHSDKPVQLQFPQARRKKQVESHLAAAQRQAEPGTGYFKVSWQGAEIQPSMHTVALANPNPTVAWGGLYWQYFEDLDKIKTFEETPLTLRKTLYREEMGDKGPVLRELTANETLKPGDKLVARLEIRVDRDMEYVHIKDMRASGLEPIQDLSGYKWQGGLGYYESPGDVATNFFVDYLPKGTFVFEYPLRVNLRGDFSNGITTIQCMYAPEFSSHTKGVRVGVY